MASPTKLYVVQHREYRIAQVERLLHFGQGPKAAAALARYPRLEPVRRVFTRRAEADAFRDQCEAAARQAGNLTPLYAAYGGFESLLKWTEFDAPVFRDWLTDHDIPDPPGWEGWEDWLAGLSGLQVARLFEALPRLEFYEVVEIDWIEEAYELDLWESWEWDMPPGPIHDPPPEAPAPNEDDIPF